MPNRKHRKHNSAAQAYTNNILPNIPQALGVSRNVVYLPTKYGNTRTIRNTILLAIS